MSRADLTPFSYVILCLVGDGGAGPHDLVRMSRHGSRQYWAAAESHYYAEPKRLAGLGYLVADVRPGRTRSRTHYTLTERGRDALRAWAREPSGFPRVQSEAIVRLLSGDIVADDAALVAGLVAMRDELDDIDRTLDDARHQLDALPHRERYLRLVHRFGRDLVRLHRDWLDEIERELGPASDGPAVQDDGSARLEPPLA
jgi:DNA-binding PadR family transcriptional regulator